jgi:hypothetical protein
VSCELELLRLVLPACRQFTALPDRPRAMRRSSKKLFNSLFQTTLRRAIRAPAPTTQPGTARLVAGEVPILDLEALHHCATLRMLHLAWWRTGARRTRSKTMPSLSSKAIASVDYDLARAEADAHLRHRRCPDQTARSYG